MISERQTMYRNFEIKQNPLTDDWLVDIGGEYGAYAGSLPRMRKIVDGYYRASSQSGQVSQ